MPSIELPEELIAEIMAYFRASKPTYFRDLSIALTCREFHQEFYHTLVESQIDTITVSGVFDTLTTVPRLTHVDRRELLPILLGHPDYIDPTAVGEPLLSEFEKFESFHLNLEMTTYSNILPWSGPDRLACLQSLFARRAAREHGLTNAFHLNLSLRDGWLQLEPADHITCIKRVLRLLGTLSEYNEGDSTGDGGGGMMKLCLSASEDSDDDGKLPSEPSIFDRVDIGELEAVIRRDPVRLPTLSLGGLWLHPSACIPLGTILQQSAERLTELSFSDAGLAYATNWEALLLTTRFPNLSCVSFVDILMANRPLIDFLVQNPSIRRAKLFLQRKGKSGAVPSQQLADFNPYSTELPNLEELTISPDLLHRLIFPSPASSDPRLAFPTLHTLELSHEQQLTSRNTTSCDRPEAWADLTSILAALPEVAPNLLALGLSLVHSPGLVGWLDQVRSGAHGLPPGVAALKRKLKSSMAKPSTHFKKLFDGRPLPEPPASFKEPGQGNTGQQDLGKALRALEHVETFHLKVYHEPGFVRGKVGIPSTTKISPTSRGSWASPGLGTSTAQREHLEVPESQIASSSSTPLPPLSPAPPGPASPPKPLLPLRGPAPSSNNTGKPAPIAPPTILALLTALPALSNAVLETIFLLPQDPSVYSPYSETFWEKIKKAWDVCPALERLEVRNCYRHWSSISSTLSGSAGSSVGGGGKGKARAEGEDGVSEEEVPRFKMTAPRRRDSEVGHEEGTGSVVWHRGQEEPFGGFTVE